MKHFEKEWNIGLNQGIKETQTLQIEHAYKADVSESQYDFTQHRNSTNSGKIKIFGTM